MRSEGARLDLSRTRMAWIGDGNNVFHSVALVGALLGAAQVIACPPGYAPHPGGLALGGGRGGGVVVPADARTGPRGADVIYTDVWTSMGQEAEREKRLEAFSRYQLNETLVSFAKVGALVMHCLPAHRGEEITDEVLDGPNSIVLDQAENRLHAQKAVIVDLLGGYGDHA